MSLEPVSRIELLAAGVQIEPISRLEKFVAAAAGTYTLPDDLKPVSRLEYFLSEIAGGGGGGGEDFQTLYLKDYNPYSDTTGNHIFTIVGLPNTLLSESGVEIKFTIDQTVQDATDGQYADIISIGRSAFLGTWGTNNAAHLLLQNFGPEAEGDPDRYRLALRLNSQTTYPNPGPDISGSHIFAARNGKLYLDEVEIADATANMTNQLYIGLSNGQGNTRSNVTYDYIKW